MKNAINVKNTTTLESLISRYPVLHSCKQQIHSAYESLCKCFDYNHRLYICGNGGSATDALHMVGELAKSFARERPLEKSFFEKVSPKLAANLQGALPAFALVENIALSSAFANDCNPEYNYAQQVYTYVRADDCVLGISTSGNSKNIIYAMETAIGRGAFTIGLTGKDGGYMREMCDICICVPETQTYRIQELHLPIYHALCLMLEEYYWGKQDL